MRRTMVGGAVSLALLLVGGACQPSTGGPPPGQPVGRDPGASWQHASPAALGLDAGTLDQIAATAQQGNSNCLVVVRHGKVAGEWYFRGTTAASTQDIFSATKSVTSTLVGIAQDDRTLRITDSASRFVPQWQGTPAAAVTIRDLLSNDSGRAWSPTIDYVQLLRATDRTAFAVALPQTSAPGTVWAYNNSAIQTLQPVLQQATGQELTAYATAKLFAPIGMTQTTMTKDAAGNAQTFEGVRSSCLDMARFGQLILDRGRWNGRQIVSARWVAQATGPSSTPLNAAYGYLWWLNHYGVIAGPLTATSIPGPNDPPPAMGRLVAGAPDSTFWALGLGNQLVQVDRGTDTVVVRLGTGVARPQPPTFGPTEASAVITQAVVGR